MWVDEKCGVDVIEWNGVDDRIGGVGVEEDDCVVWLVLVVGDFDICVGWVGGGEVEMVLEVGLLGVELVGDVGWMECVGEEEMEVVCFCIYCVMFVCFVFGGF